MIRYFLNLYIPSWVEINVGRSAPYLGTFLGPTAAPLRFGKALGKLSNRMGQIKALQAGTARNIVNFNTYCAPLISHEAQLYVLPPGVLRCFERASQRLTAAPNNSFSWRLLTRMRDLVVGVEVADVSETARAARIRVAVTCQPALTTWHDRLREACTGQDKPSSDKGRLLLH